MGHDVWVGYWKYSRDLNPRLICAGNCLGTPDCYAALRCVEFRRFGRSFPRQSKEGTRPACTREQRRAHRDQWMQPLYVLSILMPVTPFYLS